MILENERSMVRVGETVLIAPFSNSEELSTGVVSEMNPMVDKNGMIEVKAVMNNPKQTFYEGMNVRVRVQRAVEQALIIPKSALLLRNNRKVVFVAKENSAQWVYVQTGLENSESFTVTEGLQEGDSVIYEGNFNLAHEAPILVVE
jgi:RND family efflux transporter MFP subunit